MRCCLKVEATLAKTRIEKSERRAMIAGLKVPEIGKIMGVDYSTVSQGRKRFRERLKKDRAMVSKVEKKLSI